MFAGEIIELIESVAPLSNQESWDNSGLQIGQRNQQVSSALLCIDVTEDVVDEAIENNCQMIVSHHPLLFKGLKRISSETYIERCVLKIICHGLVVYSAHTSIDKYRSGVSGKMAERLGICNYSVLSPYNAEVGLGVIGDLPQPLTITDFLELLKDAFHTSVIRYLPSFVDSDNILRVAMCGGAGSEFLPDAIGQGAQAYVSADFKYHEFFNSDGRISVFDIGHFESEQHTKELFYELLADKIKCIKATKDVCQIKTFI